MVSAILIGLFGFVVGAAGAVRFVAWWNYYDGTDPETQGNDWRV